MIIYNLRYNCDKIHATVNNSIIFYANRKFVATVKYTILWTAIVKKPGAISNEGRIAMIFVRVCLTLLAPLHFELSRILSLEMFVVIGVNRVLLLNAELCHCQFCQMHASYVCRLPD